MSRQSSVVRRGSLALALGAVLLALLVVLGRTLERAPRTSTREAASVSVLVCELAPGGPAATAGIQRGDQLVAVGESQLDSYDALAAALREHRPGETIALRMRRDGADRTISVTLGERDGRSWLGLSGCPPGVS